ncbi:MAG: hypothetical protein HY512_03000 [Candidatus Aenigmarchaeota archaeon]|nr:hypothetical protein [Candidatus Aenigmarchaeota archaeon]
MLEFVLLVAGIIGFGLAGYFDLKKTEFSGWIPTGLISVSVVLFGAIGIQDGNFNLLFNSAIYGVGFLALGYVLYFLKQWGDGDTWLLGALGFISPLAILLTQKISNFFFLSVLLDFLIVSLVYTVLYSFVIGFGNNKVRKKFFAQIKIQYKLKIACVILFSAVCSLFYLFTIGYEFTGYILYLPLAFVGLVVLSDYSKVIEKFVFKKKVLTKNLRPGDVILNGRWTGVTKQEIKRIKTKYVWIKEGIRFAPVFLIAFLLSVLTGGIII